MTLPVATQSECAVYTASASTPAERSQVRPEQAVDAGQDIKYYVLYLTALGCDGQIVLDNQYLLTEMKTTVVSVRACGGLPSSSSRSAAPAGYIRAV